jgi:hypothetical protein
MVRRKNQSVCKPAALVLLLAAIILGGCASDRDYLSDSNTRLRLT